MDVDQIEKLVGGKRTIDVMDCRNQTGAQMTLSRFVRYFKRRTKRKILNLLSLEFSDTQFSNVVNRPKIVDKIDHVTQCWPVSKRTKPNGETELEWPKVFKNNFLTLFSLFIFVFESLFTIRF